jgi:U3 small nucleolar RNA-associated protein 10
MFSGGMLVEDALAILREVFNSIPTFWGPVELASVFQLYFDALALGSTGEIGSFARRVASKAPTAVLFSTYFETWPSISCAQVEVSRFCVYSSFFGSLRILA